MSLLENQSYKKKLIFYKNNNYEKMVTINIGVMCNHEINKNTLEKIEDTINRMFIDSYIDDVEYKRIKLQEKNDSKKKKDRLSSTRSHL